jgi:hypothetical protein
MEVILGDRRKLISHRTIDLHRRHSHRDNYSDSYRSSLHQPDREVNPTLSPVAEHLLELSWHGQIGQFAILVPHQGEQSLAAQLDHSGAGYVAIRVRPRSRGPLGTKVLHVGEIDAL